MGVAIVLAVVFLLVNLWLTANQLTHLRERIEMLERRLK